MVLDNDRYLNKLRVWHRSNACHHGIRMIVNPTNANVVLVHCLQTDVHSAASSGVNWLRSHDAMHSSNHSLNRVFSCMSKGGVPNVMCKASCLNDCTQHLLVKSTLVIHLSYFLQQACQANDQYKKLLANESILYEYHRVRVNGCNLSFSIQLSKTLGKLILS